MRARVALVIALMGLMWGIGVDQTPPAARVWLTAAGVWLALLGGVWMGRRSLLREQSAVQEDSPPAAHQSPSAPGLDGRTFNTQPAGQPVASSGKEGVSGLAGLVRAWVEQRLTLPRPGGHFVPPSVMPGEDLARLEQTLVRALREANAVQARIELRPIQDVEQADQLLRAIAALGQLGPAPSPGLPLVVLPFGVIGSPGGSRPQIPEWREAARRAGLIWVGEYDVPKEDGPIFIPLLLAKQLVLEPLSSLELRDRPPPRERRLYVGIARADSGRPVWLGWPWHAVVVGRTGSGKTNTASHLIFEAALLGIRGRIPMRVVATTAKSGDGMSFRIEIRGGRARLRRMDPEESAREILAVDPGSPQEGIVLLVIDEAQAVLDEVDGMRAWVERAILMGRSNGVACIMLSGNPRWEAFPRSVLAHAAWIIHRTDPADMRLLTQRIQLRALVDIPDEPGAALFVPPSREAFLIQVPLAVPLDMLERSGGEDAENSSAQHGEVDIRGGVGLRREGLRRQDGGGDPAPPAAGGGRSGP
jgi:hypothetical protein